MSNSELITYTKISLNSAPREEVIKKITIHHMATNATLEECGNAFSDPKRRVSANYGIDSNGRIAMYVEEANRAFTSSNRENDNQAITIMVANDGGAPNWHISDKALNKLIDLCVDICLRNKIEKLNFTGDASGNLTMHKYFKTTVCPGPYLESKFPHIAKEVNKILESKKPKKEIKYYRIGKTWEEAQAEKDNKYTILIEAINDCKEDDKVFDWDGNLIYPEEEEIIERKSDAEIAEEVRQGKWGYGAERRRRLIEAGYDFKVIQSLANKLL